MKEKVFKKIITYVDYATYIMKRMTTKYGILLLLCLVLTLFKAVSYSESINEGLSDNLIRLHVIANSDSVEDQKLKRDVRDKIIEFTKGKFIGINNVVQSKNIILLNINNIERVAIDEIKRQNKSYGVKVTLGRYPFPTKYYGDVALPSGTYEALRVVIGKGEGANWWCVLFPPLCFVDATHATMPDSVKRNLKEVLTDEEYTIITKADSGGDIPIKVKFKVVEVYENLKMYFIYPPKNPQYQ